MDATITLGQVQVGNPIHAVKTAQSSLCTGCPAWAGNYSVPATRSGLAQAGGETLDFEVGGAWMQLHMAPPRIQMSMRKVRHIPAVVQSYKSTVCQSDSSDADGDDATGAYASQAAAAASTQALAAAKQRLLDASNEHRKAHTFLKKQDASLPKKDAIPQTQKSFRMQDASTTSPPPPPTTCPGTDGDPSYPTFAEYIDFNPSFGDLSVGAQACFRAMVAAQNIADQRCILNDATTIGWNLGLDVNGVPIPGVQQSPGMPVPSNANDFYTPHGLSQKFLQNPQWQLQPDGTNPRFLNAGFDVNLGGDGVCVFDNRPYYADANAAATAGLSFFDSRVGDNGDEFGVLAKCLYNDNPSYTVTPTGASSPPPSPTTASPHIGTTEWLYSAQNAGVCPETFQGNGVLDAPGFEYPTADTAQCGDPPLSKAEFDPNLQVQVDANNNVVADLRRRPISNGPVRGIRNGLNLPLGSCPCARMDNEQYFVCPLNPWFGYDASQQPHAGVLQKCVYTGESTVINGVTVETGRCVPLLSAIAQRDLSSVHEESTCVFPSSSAQCSPFNGYPEYTPDYRYEVTTVKQTLSLATNVGSAVQGSIATLAGNASTLQNAVTAEMALASNTSAAVDATAAYFQTVVNLRDKVTQGNQKLAAQVADLSTRANDLVADRNRAYANLAALQSDIGAVASAQQTSAQNTITALRSLIDIQNVHIAALYTQVQHAALEIVRTLDSEQDLLGIWQGFQLQLTMQRSISEQFQGLIQRIQTDGLIPLATPNRRGTGWGEPPRELTAAMQRVVVAHSDIWFVQHALNVSVTVEHRTTQLVCQPWLFLNNTAVMANIQSVLRWIGPVGCIAYTQLAEAVATANAFIANVTANGTAAEFNSVHKEWQSQLADYATWVGSPADCLCRVEYVVHAPCTLYTNKTNTTGSASLSSDTIAAQARLSLRQSLSQTATYHCPVQVQVSATTADPVLNATLDTWNDTYVSLVRECESANRDDNGPGTAYITTRDGMGRSALATIERPETCDELATGDAWWSSNPGATGNSTGWVSTLLAHWALAVQTYLSSPAVAEMRYWYTGRLPEYGVMLEEQRIVTDPVYDPSVATQNTPAGAIVNQTRTGNSTAAPSTYFSTAGSCYVVSLLAVSDRWLDVYQVTAQGSQSEASLTLLNRTTGAVLQNSVPNSAISATSIISDEHAAMLQQPFFVVGEPACWLEANPDSTTCPNGPELYDVRVDDLSLAVHAAARDGRFDGVFAAVRADGRTPEKLSLADIASEMELLTSIVNQFSAPVTPDDAINPRLASLNLTVSVMTASPTASFVPGLMRVASTGNQHAAKDTRLPVHIRDAPHIERAGALASGIWKQRSAAADDPLRFSLAASSSSSSTSSTTSTDALSKLMQVQCQQNDAAKGDHCSILDNYWVVPGWQVSATDPTVYEFALVPQYSSETIVLHLPSNIVEAVHAVANLCPVQVTVAWSTGLGLTLSMVPPAVDTTVLLTLTLTAQPGEAYCAGTWQRQLRPSDLPPYAALGSTPRWTWQPSNDNGRTTVATDAGGAPLANSSTVPICLPRTASISVGGAPCWSQTIEQSELELSTSESSVYSFLSPEQQQSLAQQTVAAADTTTQVTFRYATSTFLLNSQLDATMNQMDALVSTGMQTLQGNLKQDQNAWAAVSAASQVFVPDSVFSLLANLSNATSSLQLLTTPALMWNVSWNSVNRTLNSTSNTSSSSSSNSSSSPNPSSSPSSSPTSPPSSGIDASLTFLGGLLDSANTNDAANWNEFQSANGTSSITAEFTNSAWCAPARAANQPCTLNSVLEPFNTWRQELASIQSQRDANLAAFKDALSGPNSLRVLSISSDLNVWNSIFTDSNRASCLYEFLARYQPTDEQSAESILALAREDALFLYQQPSSQHCYLDMCNGLFVLRTILGFLIFSLFAIPFGIGIQYAIWRVIVNYHVQRSNSNRLSDKTVMSLYRHFDSYRG